MLKFHFRHVTCLLRDGNIVKIHKKKTAPYWLELEIVRLNQEMLREERDSEDVISKETIALNIHERLRTTQTNSVFIFNNH